MGIEPTSVAWEATVMAIIRRPRDHDFTREHCCTATAFPAYIGSHAAHTRLRSRSHAKHGQRHGQTRHDHQQHLNNNEQNDRR